jgi:uncharacterized membrane protein YhaH (DUF805 family)
VPFLTFGMVVMTQLMSAIETANEPDFGLFPLMFLNNALYMVALVTLIVFLALPGTKGPNRFGPEATD